MWGKWKGIIISDTHTEPDEIPGVSGSRRLGWAVLCVAGIAFWAAVIGGVVWFIN